jgi:hypothetical protein
MRFGGGAFLPAKGILVFGNRYPALKRQARSATTILIEDPDDYGTALKDIKAGRFDPRAIAVFDRSPNPDIVLDKLDSKIKKNHLLFNIPQNLDEAKAIHPTTAEGVLNGYMPTFNDIAREMTELGGIKIAPSSEPASTWLSKYLENVEKDELVLIVSHVKRGDAYIKNADGDPIEYPEGILPLIDGSSYSISTNANQKALVWTIGCDTWDTLSEGFSGLAITRRIEYREGLDMVKRIMRSQDTVRGIVHDLQNLDFEGLPSNPPKKLKSAHFKQVRPQSTYQLVVENIPSSNLLTDLCMEVA